ncbi:MAG: gliding motility lipoprotein GldB [Winogradskyella sp.]
MQIRIYLILILILSVVSCNEDSKLTNKIAKIEANFVVERFERAFFTAKPKDLPSLKKAYPFLFSKHVPDSVWVARMKDTLQNELFAEVTKVYSDIEDTKQELTSLFQHLKYHNKTFKIPRVITLTNSVDYRKKNIVNDSLVLIAIDNYLGDSHRFYQNISKYLTANMQQSQIVVDVAESYARRYTFQTKRRTLLDEMIYFGKLLYFKDVMLPYKTDAKKIGYTEDQLKWAEANERAIWSHFIEKEMLYSTDSKLPNRFIADAPFSKFYLELDNESPGRLGQYIGWQIVKAYAKNTKESVMTILQKSPEELFNKSNFKPKR